MEDGAPIFGLRYLEEEAAEINGIAGCLMYDQPPIGDYATNCDYADYD